MSVTIEEMIAEVKREIAMRKNVYPTFIKQGKLKRDEANSRHKRLVAVLRLLEEQPKSQPEIFEQ